MELHPKFNYEDLEPENRLLIQQRTQELKERLQRTAQDIWEIGQSLADVRSRLKYGQFESWLKAEFGWSRRTAYNFINVYQTFGDRAKFAQVNVAPSVLYLLASPSTPKAVREEIIQQAKTGNKVTYKDIRRAVSKKKQSQSRAAANKSTKSKSTKSSSPNQAKDKVNIDTELPEPNPPDPIESAVSSSQPQWYLLEKQHLLFCGDTNSSSFIERLPFAAIGLSVSAWESHHQWLTKQARTTIILDPEKILEQPLIEQLLFMFSQPKEAVILPWLPSGEIIAVVHKLDRLLYTGDSNFERCSQAIALSGLQAEKIDLI